MERKSFPAFITKTDKVQGIVETIFAVFGNEDLGKDIIHPGAFVKTFAEHGGKVKVLDLHNIDSILRVLGRPLAFRELRKDELPETLLLEYPEATGAAWAQVKFNLETRNGHDAFLLIAAGDVDEWSFAYDALDFDFTGEDGKEVRNLRTLKLWELSPVIWGMNPATTTTDAKERKPEAEETDTHIRIRVRDPEDFEDGSFRTIPIAEDRGISAVIGRLKGETTTTVQSYIFAKDKEDWTIASAQAWVDEHDKTIVALTEVVYSVTAESEVNTESILAVALGAMASDIAGTSKAGPDDDPTHPDNKGAGPDDGPSTDKDLLKRIEIEQQQLTLMEV